MRRRDFLKFAALAPLCLNARAQTLETSPWTVAGDVSGQTARIAAGGLGPGPLRVTWSPLAASLKETAVTGGTAGRASDFTAQATLRNLPPDSTIFYRASGAEGSVTGTFRTPPTHTGREVTFLWGGDVAGQGWGIDPSRGGMLTFRTMLEEKPDFFIHCGDSIYADESLRGVVQLDDGTLWRNIITPAKSKPASSLADFHGNYSYNLLDPHYRAFFQQVPVIVQWDDHEVLNDWNPRMHGRQAAKAFRAFRNYWPFRPAAPGRLYRRVSYGPNVDVFVLDLRSYRAPNSDNRQPSPGPDAALLGQEQLRWLKKSLVSSKATWKIVAGEMPIATFSPRFGLDSWANGPGAPLGREFELAELLGHLVREQVRNVVWLSADVHFGAAFHFHPKRAAFKSFHPFWEFVAGPLHAGTFTPHGDPDPTFGADLVYCTVPPDMRPNRPPSDDLQFYGKMVAGRKSLRVSLHQRRGKELYAVRLSAE